jgi:myo-inositol-1(or 4)-monophosphatase
MTSAVRADQDLDLRGELPARLALIGGKMALERFEGAQVFWKGDDSMVTNADLEIQSWLVGEITEAFPDDGVLGEEGLAPGPSRTDAPYVWVLDPLDGTNNFGRGMPGFSVSIGVLRDGHPAAGAVYDPLGDQLFKASEGNGAWCNGRLMKLAPASLSARSLFTIRTPWPEGVPPWVEGWMRRYRLRRVGSTALHLCYVALGALAFVHDRGASLWDIAGAAPVVLEAGGRLTTTGGEGLFPVDPRSYRGLPLEILAGNSAAHGEAIRDIRSATARVA